MDLAIGRGAYICQSQSLNLYLAEPNFSKMTSMHFYGWKNGLKTGQYYLRSRPARDAIKFTVNVEALLKATDQGNTEEILDVLNTGASTETKARTDSNSSAIGRYTAESSLHDEVKGEKLPENGDIPEEDEEDDSIFECINCSG